MKKLFWGAFILLSAPVLSAQTALGPKPVRFFKFQLDVFEQRGDQVGLADSRTVEVPEGKTRGFMAANFTLDLTVKPQGKGAAVNFRLVTLPPEVATKSGTAILDSGQLFNFPNIPGKMGSRYRLALSYQGKQQKTVTCSYEDFQWYSDPTPHFNLGFVSNTWGDFHWNSLRDRVEDAADSLLKVFHLTTSQKPAYYFVPCPLSDWVWDGRFYFSLEPSRLRALSVYSREANSFSPWVTNLLLFYLSWGHAPAPLAEGAAAYFDYPHFFAQRLLKEKQLDSLAGFLTTYRYRKCPPEKGLVQAASFVRFLMERYGSGTFEHLYRQATDLTVREDLQRLYAKSLDSLENEWRVFLATFEPAPEPLRRVAGEDYSNFRFRDALELYKRALALDPAPRVEDCETMAGLFYNLGQYDSALAFYLKAYSLDSARWQRAYVAANFYLLLDDTLSARNYYQKILELDTTIADGMVRMGSYYFEIGQFARAESLYLRALKKRISPDDLAELNLNLGFITWKRKGDFRRGNEMLNAAWGYYRQVLGSAPEVPLPYLRQGELFMYKNMPDSAEANLQFALYLETRPYYTAKILVRLGNLYDLLNRRGEALAVYRRVEELPAAPLERRRARACLKTPFSLPAS